MEILIKRLNENAKLPSYGRETGPGMDLYTIDSASLKSGESVVVSTGIAMAIPAGYVGVVVAKEGISLNKFVDSENGIVDSGYRNEIKIQIVNNGAEEVSLESGQKVAQLLIQKIELPHIIEAEELS